jgi:myo-inositol-1(or 4)-monophosphatase
MRVKHSYDMKGMLRFAWEMAADSGQILKKGFMRGKDISYKGRIDPVTEYDLQSEKLITDRIRGAYPDHDLLAEEGSEVSHEAEFRWIIDPLDGTVNFSHGFPVYCVSIALEYRRRLVMGVVYDPEREEMFWAVDKSGAHLNDHPIHVTGEGRLHRALLATGFAYDIGTARRNNLGLFSRMAKKAQGIRRPGSAALDLCWLAAGRIDGFWELKLHPWDTAAALVIVREAGGRVTRLDGGRYSIFDKEILASNGRIHRSMSRVLSGKD